MLTAVMHCLQVHQMQPRQTGMHLYCLMGCYLEEVCGHVAFTLDRPLPERSKRILSIEVIDHSLGHLNAHWKASTLHA